VIGALLAMVGLGRLVGLVLIALIAYVAVASPDWAIDPLRSLGEAVFEAVGAAAYPLAAWLLVVLALLRFNPVSLLRKWRYVLGSSFVIFAALAALAQFEGELPLIGSANLGGTVGQDVGGGSSVLGWATAILSGALGVWVALPRRLSRQLTRRSVNATATGSSQTARASRGAGRFFRRSVRDAARVATGARNAVAAARGPRPEDTELAQGLKDFLSSAAPVEALPLHEALSAAAEETSDVYPEPGGATVEAAATQSPAAGQLTASRAPVPRAPRPARAKTSGWALPTTEMLNAATVDSAVTDEHRATARLIEEALADHRVEVHVAEIRPGPTVTMFGLVPGWNQTPRRGRADDESAPASTRNRVRVDAILAREKDLALALAAPSLRIEAPVPGESVVGVEVPNKTLTGVPIRSIVESAVFAQSAAAGGLPVALGQASAGEPVVIDLLKMPHLLIAGATGSGKSVCINTILASILLSQRPEDVRLMLVDPKRVELTPYNGIPHLVTPVVVEPSRVVRLLRGAIQEMLRRYQRLEEASVRNVQAYNRSAKATEHMPYLVICIDELADLMMTSAFEVEQGICRLAQLGRATGIHLVVATQRPSVDVVTGLIKANFPSRISFAVASQVDSRTILDTVGAERLLGRGDMLFLSPDAAKPKRVQGAYVADDETEALADHWRSNQGGALADIDLEDLAREAELAGTTLNGAPAVVDGDGDGPLYQRALDLASRTRSLSTSLLQRRLRIGYPRAARLMDQLEDEGIVASSAEPGKPRTVLYTPNDT
jgi:S-DNA-T family DNA segregation ATPase FtsK/SpoIIIE